ncbi:DUF4142 domain-containing protein [Streptomyces sp. NPDC002845]
MPISRNMGTVLVSGALLLTVGALAYPATLGIVNSATDSERIVDHDNPYGPLTEADRDFVVQVRAAGLWEYPLGEMAMERGTTPEMREAGEHLVVGHAGLDEMCRRIAPELEITLPNQASPQQEQFVASVGAESGIQFDSSAVNIMRVTHGKIFPAIAKIRATTKNTLVRELANLANDTVLDHITVLEKTGMVNFDQANFQQTAAPKLPEDMTTPPPPQRGAPVVVLTPRPDLDVNTRNPSPPTPTAASTNAG